MSGAETAIAVLIDCLTANGVELARLRQAKGTVITVPAAAELKAELL